MGAPMSYSRIDIVLRFLVKEARMAISEHKLWNILARWQILSPLVALNVQ